MKEMLSEISLCPIISHNYIHFKFEDIHNSWLYCFTNPLELQED